MTPLPRLFARTLCAGVALAGLGGCAIPLGAANQSPQPSADAVAACNKRADQVFLSQNRDAVYQQDRYQTSQRDTPYSGAGLSQPSAGLSDQFARHQDFQNCLNGGTDTGSTQPAKAAP
jgi:hypothetical protein